MNILFIEDEKELLEIAISQLVRLGHVVFPALDIAEAREVLHDPSKNIQMVITDHRLPDGRGIQFAVELKKTYPQARLAIVSGCLTDSDIAELEAHELLYFRKPLLYGKVVETVRKHYSMKANIVQPVSVDEFEEEGVELAEVEEVKKKKLWSLFNKTPKSS
ncbi:MAG TPA: hypothetical protein DCX06_06720 [Opitutae bacterium]|nr:hypothetical protein [Opitutae bacterium]